MQANPNLKNRKAGFYPPYYPLYAISMPISIGVLNDEPCRLAPARRPCGRTRLLLGRSRRVEIFSQDCGFIHIIACPVRKACVRAFIWDERGLARPQNERRLNRCVPLLCRLRATCLVWRQPFRAKEKIY